MSEFLVLLAFIVGAGILNHFLIDDNEKVGATYTPLSVNWDKPPLELGIREGADLIAASNRSDDPRALLYKANVARHSANVDAHNGILAPLQWDARLEIASAFHATEMVELGFFAHRSPSGETPLDRAYAVGYFHGVGENIAKGQRTVENVHKAWMNSPGHRANILNPHASVMAAARVGDVWVEMFGTSAD